MNSCELLIVMYEFNDATVHSHLQCKNRKRNSYVSKTFWV